MASVHIARWVDMEFMFNISAGVGRGRPNHKHDVMLIQYLLSHARNEDKDGSAYRRIWPPDLHEALNQDGIVGTKTQKFIDFYQAYRNQNTTRSDRNQLPINFQVAQDGAIDPWKFPAQLNLANARNKGAVLTRTDTLVTLCYDAAKDDDIKSGYFHDMHPELLRILCAH